MKLVSFDFDRTLCLTPEPDYGKEIYKNVTGQNWPHRGWWGRPETLDLDIFSIPLEDFTYNEYVKFHNDEDAYLILATGRLTKLRNEVQSILDYHSLEFDEIHLNPGIDTFKFKSELFSKLIFKLKPDTFTMYDDRQEHLEKFEIWAKTQPCQIHIIDIVKKEHKIIN